MTKPRQPGRARKLRHIEPALSVLLAAILIAAGEFVADRGLVSPLILPAPSDVLFTMIDGFREGSYVTDILSTTGSLLAGFVLGTAISLVFAGVLISAPLLERVLTPFIVAFQSMPKVAIAPLIILWIGFGEASKIVIVITVCFFPIMVNTLQGLRIRDRDRYELLQSLGASRWQMFWHLRLPDAVPYIFAGLHIGAIFALIGAVVAEFVGSSSGLGYAMLQAKASFDVPGVYVCLLLLMVLGILLNMVMTRIERHMSFWAQDLSGVTP